MKRLCLAVLVLLPLTGQLLAQGIADSNDESQQATIERVVFRGNRRIPERTLKSWILTRKGRMYNTVQLDRDIRALYSTGHFQDVKVFAEGGLHGGKIITFEVMDRPVIGDVVLGGMDWLNQSKIIEEWQRLGLRISKGSYYDAVEAGRAAKAVKGVAEGEGYGQARVQVVVEEITALEVRVIFKLE